MVATSKNKRAEGTSGGPRFRRSNWAVPFRGAALPSACFTCLLHFLPPISRPSGGFFVITSRKEWQVRSRPSRNVRSIPQFVNANTPPTPLPIYGTVSSVGRGARIAWRNGADNSSVRVGLNLSGRGEALRWGRPARLKKVGSGAKKPKTRRESARHRARPRSLKRGERDSEDAGGSGRRRRTSPEGPAGRPRSWEDEAKRRRREVVAF
ncbi:unnamed protein product [Bursaphelenchus xylophilus]|uniref:(pine wood nematode) hypothetical protein n=1 Tax=Bursaphelenchus xylophilus TaxID=6326 RepID=A0A811L2R7_BURXY|nr:unnamed protein product [Bursaphelenchus xylophilus]CAG9110123.1 unnamed protein product [Bursaphelenchus xylophilus]